MPQLPLIVISPFSLVSPVTPRYCLLSAHDGMGDLSVVIVALITGCTTLVGAWFVHRARMEELRLKQRDLKTEKESLRGKVKTLEVTLNKERELAGVGARFVALLYSIEQECRNLHNHYGIERVVLLSAVNGGAKPTHTTALWQFRAGASEDFHIDYHHVELDLDYQDRISRCRRTPHRFKTSNVPEDTLLGHIYAHERIVESVWVTVHEEEKDSGNLVVIYMSFSVTKGDISNDAMQACSLLRGKIQELLQIEPSV